MTVPGLRFAFEIEVEVGDPLDFGQTQAGYRRVIPIAGGLVSGPKLRGRVVPGGADWQILRPDGTGDLDARYTIQSEGGELIYVVNRGIRHGPPDVLARLNRANAWIPRPIISAARRVLKPARPTTPGLLARLWWVPANDIPIKS